MAGALVLGAFEILHWGHLDFLMKATDFGKVVVGLTSDELLEETKRPPAFPYHERKDALERFGWEVVERRNQSAKDVFTKVQPGYFVCGNDWLGQDHLAASGVSVEFLNRMGVAVVYLPRDHQMSTSRIIEAVKEANHV